MLVYLHGGGLTGAITMERPSSGASGLASSIPTYRLYPDAKYPEFMSRSRAALACTDTARRRVRRRSAKDFRSTPFRRRLSDRVPRAHARNSCPRTGLSAVRLRGFHPDQRTRDHSPCSFERTGFQRRIIVDDAAP